ncbi:MAG: glutamate 5-kinase [Candidatus Verstraetearchaeota archaeon]|nr:glutamate 5-kinase [Candidatus Verstraetearchaeota archaeon]
MVVDEGASRKEQRCRRDLKSAKLVVVKIGGSSLSNASGALDLGKIGLLCDELANLKRRGIDVVLVSSGAIRGGRAIMRDRIKNGEIPGLQALAAIGQVVLMEAYRDTMAGKGYNVAQILLTWDDFRNKRRLRNLLNTFNILLSLGVIPVINENDTIAVDEIKFGDNDTLSALVAKYMQADLLILLSDVNGLYTGDPKSTSSRLISCVETITPEIERLTSGGHGGFGGMRAKLKAAKLATDASIPMVVANGAGENVLERIIAGERVGTIFIPRDPHEQ